MRLKKILLMLVPRFITEDVALVDVGDHFEIACSMVDVQPGERFDGMTTIQGFTWFNKVFPAPWLNKSLDVKPFPYKDEM